MKKLITVNEIKQAASAGQKAIYLEPGTIITPAARDAAREQGIVLNYAGDGPIPTNVSRVTGPQQGTFGVDSCAEGYYGKPTIGIVANPNVNDSGTNVASNSNANVVSNSSVNANVDPGMISRVVKEILAAIPGLPKREMDKEVDPSGICLVRGKTVECEDFDTGKPGDKVGIKEILSRKESPDLATGFMTLEETSFEWTLGYDEVDYIIEGILDITIDGRTYRGRAGDVFFIPKNTHITFSTPDKVKFFFVTYPANWADLSNKS